MERLLFRRLLLVGLVLCLACQHSLELLLAVPLAQRFETDEPLLPGAFDRSVLAPFDLIALLLQCRKKGFKICGLLVHQDGVNDPAQPLPVALFWRVGDALLPLPVGLSSITES